MANDGNSRGGSLPATRGIILGQLLSKDCIGGAEVLAAHLANCHALSGQPSHVIVLGEKGLLSHRVDPAVSVHYCHFTRSSLRNPIRFAWSILRGWRIINSIIVKNQIDVLQTHLPDTNMWGLFMQMMGRCKVVVTIHSNRFFSSSGGTRVGRWVTHRAYSIMVNYCLPVITVSQKIKESFIEQLHLSLENGSKVKVIENGIPIHEIPGLENRAAVRDRFGIREDDCWVIAAGRFAEPKNFQCLIRAAAIIKVRGVGMQFLIGGDGPLRSELELLARELDVQDIVSMPGNLDGLPEIMPAADIFAIPSLWEGLPLALLEAMAAGLPVVGSHTKGIADIIAHGQQGLLSEVNDVVGLAESLAILANDGGLARTMGTRGRELVCQRYDIQRVYSEYLGIYSEKLAN